MAGSTGPGPPNRFINLVRAVAPPVSGRPTPMSAINVGSSRRHALCRRRRLQWFRRGWSASMGGVT